MTVEEIAKKHGVSVDKIESELRIGMTVEKEHGGDEEERREYSLEHLEEIPDYYTRLLKMEQEAKEEGLDDDKMDKAFKQWGKKEEPEEEEEEEEEDEKE